MVGQQHGGINGAAIGSDFPGLRAPEVMPLRRDPAGGGEGPPPARGSSGSSGRPNPASRRRTRAGTARGSAAEVSLAQTGPRGRGRPGSARRPALTLCPSCPPDKTVKLWKVSERDKRPEGYNLKDEDGRLRDPSMITVLRVSVRSQGCRGAFLPRGGWSRRWCHPSAGAAGGRVPEGGRGRLVSEAGAATGAPGGPPRAGLCGVGGDALGKSCRRRRAEVLCLSPAGDLQSVAM